MNNLYRNNIKATLISLLAIVVLALVILLALNLTASGYETSILITEVLSSNAGAVLDEDGSSPDFIELYNAGGADVSLHGWFLSDNSNRPMKWIIPDIVLSPGQYVYFFASGKDKQQADGVWHTSFQISSDSTEQIVLSTPDGTVHRHFEPFETIPNVSFGVDDTFDTLVYMTVPTPGAANGIPFFSDFQILLMHNTQRGMVLITEYMTQNETVFPDENGLFHDWVELFNPGTDPVSLRDWNFSDNPDRLQKWTFPEDMMIQPGEYIVLHCSGLDLPSPVQDTGSQNTHIHVPFRLSPGDRQLTLSDQNGNIVDEVALVDTTVLASRGRALPGTVAFDAGEFGFFEVPTPGAANTGELLTSIEDISWDAPTVIITEYMTNNTFFVDDDGHTSDWVEIHNYGSEVVDLSELYLSDKADNLDKWQFPDFLTISPGEYMQIWLSAKTHLSHASFSIGADDDGLYISDGFGRVVDSVSIITLPTNVSGGRDENDNERWLFYPRPTPGEPNTTQGFPELAGLALSSYGSLFEDEETEEPRTAHVQTDADVLNLQVGQHVSLWTDDPGAVIYYTLDGREPTQSSIQYTAPIEILGNTILRARAYSSDKLPGPILSRTYIPGANHAIPVVALASDPDGLFSSSTGIYADGPGWTEEEPHIGANFWKNWERAVNFAYYDGGDLQIDADAGISIHGQNSRQYPQKSLNISFKRQYGPSQLIYPLIPGISRTVFDAVILRNSGQDIYETKLRDAVTNNIVLDVTNVIAMGARPVAVYINGAYWGLYNLHEKINEDYLELNEGIPNGEVDIIKQARSANRGTLNDFLTLENTLRSMMSRGEINTPEAFSYIDANIDLDNWIDYWVTVTYFGNTATHNIKCFREHGDDGKWRWVLYDQDHALRLLAFNPIANMLSSGGHGGYHGDWALTSNVVERALMSNDTVKDMFLERYAEMLRTVLSPDRQLSIINDYAAQIAPEIPQHFARWSPYVSFERWEENVEHTRIFVRGREDRIKQHLQSTLSLSPERMEEIFG